MESTPRHAVAAGKGGDDQPPLSLICSSFSPDGWRGYGSPSVSAVDLGVLRLLCALMDRYDNKSVLYRRCDTDVYTTAN